MFIRVWDILSKAVIVKEQWRDVQQILGLSRLQWWILSKVKVYYEYYWATIMLS